MKKTFFMMGIAALVLSSCSQEDVLSVNDSKLDSNAISFRVRSAKTSRSAEFSTYSLDDFMLFGYKGCVEDGDVLTPYFNKTGEAVKFSRLEGDVIFTSNPTYYYPVDGSWLTFRAYAPSNLTGISTDQYGGIKYNNFTVDTDITKQIDLICADGGSNLEPEDDDQELTFQHALTKVYISEVLNTDERFKYEIIGVKFGNIHTTGDFEYEGERWIARTEDEPCEAFDSNGYIWDGNGQICWKPTGTPTSEITYIFDEPIIVDKNNQRPTIMTGDDTDGNDGKQNFMMIPQQLSADFVNEEGTINSGTFGEGMTYIAFLVRITNTITDEVIYPYAEGVDNISKEIEGVKYAWAAFPISSLWVPGHYVDYFVDFSNGAGYVAPGAEGMEDKVLEFTPILGRGIQFTETVNEWNQGAAITVDHNNHLTIDEGNFDDAFGDD